MRDFCGLEAWEDHSVNMLYTYDEADRLTGIVGLQAGVAAVDITDTAAAPRPRGDDRLQVRALVLRRCGFCRRRSGCHGRT